METNIKNLKEFKALVKRYESITEEEIQVIRDSVSLSELHKVSRIATGFGTRGTCTLCRVCGCTDCVYLTKFDTSNAYWACTYGLLKESYDLIEEANSARLLLKAYRNRAKVLRELLGNLL